MTRVAKFIALALGLLLIGGGWAAEMWSWVAAGVALFALASLVPRSGPAQLALAVVALVTLGVALPNYYRSPRFWPELAVIGLSSLVFALGTLGYILDRYRGSQETP
jgi:hypothetical protein